MDVLVALVRGHAPECDISGDEWAALIRLARRHRVLWVLQERIESLRIELPFIASRRLLRAARQDAGANLRQILALRELLRSMASADVKIVPLKGPAMLERLYGDANKRPCADLDVLIRLEDLERCNAVLLALGYEEKWLGEPYKWTWIRGAIMIEVHSDFDERPVLDFPMAPVWERVRAAEFQGQPAWQMSAADELVFLCLHAARHQFDSLSLMVELQRAFAVLGEAMNGALPDWYEARTVPGVVLLAREMTEHMRNAYVTLNVKADARIQRKIPAIVNRLWAALMQQKASPKTRLGVYRFLRELEPRWTARAAALWKQSWMSVERVSVDDVARAKSLGATSKLGQRCVRQARQLVKVARHCVRR
jgi:hypothetical protein